MITKIEKFGATWCGPCHALDKTMTEVLKTFTDINYETFDADEDEEKFEEKHILNVPQLFFYDEEGKEVKHLVGAVPLAKITEVLNKYK